MNSIHPIKFLLFTFTLVFFTIGCTATEEPISNSNSAVDVTIITVSGSGSITPVLSALVEGFESDTPNYRLEVLPGSGTGGGIQGLKDGVFSMAAMSRPPRDNEAESGIDFAVIGNSTTAIIAHPDVSNLELTSDQLKSIFSGDATNWSEVGGPDLDIALYIRDPEEGNTIDVRDTFIGDIEFSSLALMMSSQTEMQEAVSGVSGAVGYGTWAAAKANEADVVNLTVDGISATTSLETLSTTIGIGYLTEDQATIQPFIDWVSSPNGQEILKSLDIQFQLLSDG